MLKIGAIQQAAFERAALADFEGRMLAHLRRFSPRHLRIVGDAELGGLIVVGQKRAELYGLVSERSARIYIEMMVMFGIGFDADPQHVWASEPLRGGDDEHARADRLHAAAWRHVDRTAGEDLDGDGRVVPGRAVAQLQQFAREPEQAPIDETLLDLRVRLVGQAQRVFPRKCEDIGEAAVVRAVKHALATARTFGLVGERGLALFAGLAVMLGAEFYHDPQFMWAKRALGDASIPDERTRVDRMHRGAMDCLERFWGGEA